MNKEDIRQSIVDGLKDVFNYFTAAGISIQDYVKPEYLITSCIAQRLSRNNHADRLMIRLEEPTSQFASNCFPLFKNGNFQTKQETGRPGKVDIAIYSKVESGYNPHKSHCCVEVKNINPRKYTVLSDIERLIDFLNLNDDQGLPSELGLSFFVCIEEVFGMYKDEVQQKVAEVQMKFEKWLQNSQLFETSIKSEVSVEIVDPPKYSRGDIFELKGGETESDFINDNFCRMSVIIELSKGKIG